MLFPTDDCDASRSPPPGRPAGATLLQSGLLAPAQIFRGRTEGKHFPAYRAHAARGEALPRQL